MHSISTKYNILYNGNIAFDKGIAELNSTYKENFLNLLPIEPLKVDVLALPGMKAEGNPSGNFEKAEEKAVKAIQKHSLVQARIEHNKQIDDAYLLLGKSRYYSKRFVPALEAFNFIIKTYPYSKLINETKIWQAKTQIRLHNEEQAIRTLNSILQIENLKEDIVEKVHTTLAMAYFQTGEDETAKQHLLKASETVNDREQTARNLFILAQLYQKNNQLDSSNIAFQKVIDLKRIPYKYTIHSKIEKSNNSKNSADSLAVADELISLIKDRDNRPYLDILYYQLGKIHAVNNSEKGIELFNKSLAASNEMNLQKELSYEAIGNLYFDKADFLTAGTYYDSILQITQDQNSKRVRRLTRKRKSLDDIIFFENIAKSTDSILGVVAMSKEEQTTFYNAHIEKLKAEQAKKELAKENTNTGIFSFIKKKEKGNAGKWYFYNVQTTGFGKQEFRKTWGTRPLEDNWRLSDKTQLIIGNNNQPLVSELSETEYNVEKYLKRIPSNSTTIDSLKNERINAYFKLGVIYKDQFKEPQLALEKLEKLLTFNPSQNIVLPTKYHLYKIYSVSDSEKANNLRNDIITNYADSKYAQIILNPDKYIVDSKENNIEKTYVELYNQYKNDAFDTVIEKSTEAINSYVGDPLIAKFELLKAYAIGKRDGLPAFKKALEFVAMNYPNTKEGKKALEVIETIKNKN